MKKFWVMPLFCFLLASCATGYHPSGFSGGYEELKLAKDAYLVGFRGNAYTSSDKAHIYAMRRSAELTLDKGYKFFVIEKSKDKVDTSAYRTPVQAHSNSNYNVYGYGNYGNIYGNTNTTVTGGDLIVSHRPKSAVLVKMYHKKVPNSLDAEIFLSNFDKKK